MQKQFIFWGGEQDCRGRGIDQTNASLDNPPTMACSDDSVISIGAHLIRGISHAQVTCTQKCRCQFPVMHNFTYVITDGIYPVKILFTCVKNVCKQIQFLRLCSQNFQLKKLIYSESFLDFAQLEIIQFFFPLELSCSSRFPSRNQSGDNELLMSSFFSPHHGLE